MQERYEMLERLGEGGAGTVFKAWDRVLERHVAVKKLLPEERREVAGAGTDLKREAAALSSLQHPNVVSIFDLDFSAGEPRVVMEFLNGETLEQTLRRGALPLSDFMEVARQTFEALLAAHRLGVQHRDIKPSNIMLNWLANGAFQLKVLDFGLADFSARPSVTISEDGRSVYGSIHFMAPEQLTGKGADARTDIYSLGCVLYYVLTGSRPFNGATVEEVIDAHLKHRITPLRQLRTDAPPPIADWVHWLINPRPEDRPQSASHALDALLKIKNAPAQTLAPAAQRPVQVKTSAVPVRMPRPAGAASAPAQQQREESPAPPKPKKRGAKPAVLAGIGLATAAGVAALVVFLIKRDPAGGTAGSGGAGAVASPPKQGLVVWLDGAKGMLAGLNAPAKPGERVSIWEDQCPEGGANAASYVHTRTREADRVARLPTLGAAGPAQGFKASFPTLHFNGTNHFLLMTRDTNDQFKAVSNNIGVYDSPEQTFLLVACVSGTARQHFLSCSQTSGSANADAWDFRFDQGKITVGLGKASASLPVQETGQSMVIAVVYEAKAEKMTLWLRGAGGRELGPAIATGLKTRGTVDRLRMGAVSRPQGTQPSSHFLNGHIAEFLFYNRALPEKDRLEAASYLSGKYFGG